MYQFSPSWQNDFPFGMVENITRHEISRFPVWVCDYTDGVWSVNWHLAHLRLETQFWLASSTASLVNLAAEPTSICERLGFSNSLVSNFLCWISNHVLHPNDLCSIWGTSRAVADPGTSNIYRMPKHGDPTRYTNCAELDRTPVSLQKYYQLESLLPWPQNQTEIHLWQAKTQ